MEYYNMLLPLAIILIVSKLLAKACTKFNLPTVVGLLITGLLMSLIRYIPGQTILDATALDGIGFLAKIGVILIMFETGLETDVKQLRDVGVGAVIITMAGVALPMGLGFVVAVLFHGGFADLTHDALVSCLFYGTILTATSVSVTVTTLREMGRISSKVGSTIVTAAVLDDIIGVVVLSFVIAMQNTAAVVTSPMMVVGKIVLFFVCAIPLGILLFITDRKSFLPMPKFHFVLSIIINATRSVPFIILLVAIIPFTRLVVGSSIGTAAAIVPLTISVAPFIARIVETSLREVDKGLVEAAQAMGATNLQIVGKVLLPEARPGILAGLTIAVVSLIGYSAMAGVVGGGGLGDLGIRYGYQRFMPEVMWPVVLVLIILVQGIQSMGDYLVRRLSHK